MLNKILKLYFLLFILTQINSEDIKKYELQLINQISVGKNNNEIGYKPFYLGGIPLGLGFDNNYKLYISDNANDKLNIYNNDIIFLNNFFQKFISTIKIFEFNNNLILNKGWHTFLSAYDKKGHIKFYIDLDSLNINDFNFAYDYSIFFYNTVFYYSNNHQLICINDPTINQDINKKKIRNTEETRKLIKSQYKELTLDYKDRIILNGKILTRIFKDYIEYWDEVHIGQSPPKNFNKSYLDKAEDYFSRESSAVYYGKDKDGNWYWGSMLGVHPHVFIFDENGWIIEAFAIKESDKQVYKNMQIYPAIHPLGDVYYLDFDGKSNYLYMVPRTWGYNKITKGTCTENGISIRLRPSVKADILGKLNKDDEIEIIDKTDIKLQVEEAYNYWYKIKLSDGKSGWVFGEYVKE